MSKDHAYHYYESNADKLAHILNMAQPNSTCITHEEVEIYSSIIRSNATPIYTTKGLLSDLSFKKLVRIFIHLCSYNSPNEQLDQNIMKNTIYAFAYTKQFHVLRKSEILQIMNISTHLKIDLLKSIKESLKQQSDEFLVHFLFDLMHDDDLFLWFFDDISNLLEFPINCYINIANEHAHLTHLVHPDGFYYRKSKHQIEIWEKGKITHCYILEHIKNKASITALLTGNLPAPATEITNPEETALHVMSIEYIVT